MGLKGFVKGFILGFVLGFNLGFVLGFNLGFVLCSAYLLWPSGWNSNLRMH